MDVPKDQISTLLDHGLSTSAQVLGSFLVSSSSANAEANPHVKAENLVLLGDALLRDKEYRRAIHMYKQALQYHRSIPKQTSASSRSSLSTSNRSSSPNSFNVSAVNENEVKFKIASCHSSLNENKAALLELEGIPSKARTLQMNLLMGKLYRNSRNSRAAIACYRECLRNCFYVVEAIIALAELGVTPKNIISLIPQTPNRGNRGSYDHLDSMRWLQRYVEAQCCIASNDYKGGLELYAELLQQFPNNVHILLEMAKVEAIIGKNDEAIMNFEKARPEVFVALSVMWERKDDKGALSHAEKSIQIDERHIPGYIMKGNLYLLMDRPEAAVIAFRGARELRPDLRSYQGLVRSYLACSKVKEALHTAREAMKAMPQSARALKLVGDVHASNPGGREKAKKFYESALRLEPGFLGAALALAELHVIEGRNGDAVALLERYLKDWADDSLHVKLAQVFSATNMLQDALAHYQAALRINSQNEAAKKGLDRLEKQMKGVDPDAPDEDEENDIEDVDADVEETELLA
ncbi:anaphase-promoting complex subunit 7 isoform X2 [Rhodamnia argentea]|uniref:Anaphase-promoting complex subunit 7 isoform X2 n=1 Tax=Rhodamnia argentea TaxID=178133 RepID=A0ABM3HHP9_9MYRT|nr:anaphase-promoting complex subunit 7 isoform X2 [Rhodamnia argentea]